MLYFRLSRDYHNSSCQEKRSSLHLNYPRLASAIIGKFTLLTSPPWIDHVLPSLTLSLPPLLTLSLSPSLTHSLIPSIPLSLSLSHSPSFSPILFRGILEVWKLLLNKVDEQGKRKAEVADMVLGSISDTLKHLRKNKEQQFKMVSVCVCVWFVPPSVCC